MRIEHLEKDRAHESHWSDFPTIELPDRFPTFSTGYPIEPKFTHYLPVFSGSLDHIFVSQASEQNPFGFEPLHSAPMPTVADVAERVGMPSEKLPSDHISLVADLTFAKR
jgi:mRNA deadenylase 3'-5' endonuclease subunit Ccr4